MTTEIHIRAATKSDATALAELINMAGEGMPVYLWEKAVQPGETVWDLGRQRARREEGGFSYRNATVLEDDGDVVASLIGYEIEQDPPPIDYDEMPAMFAPLQELENAATATWYVNALATYPQYRGKRYGAQLLTLADKFAAELGLRGTSLIVADANQGARRLYERCGYVEIATRKMVKEDWTNRSNNWILMIKEQ